MRQFLSARRGRAVSRTYKVDCEWSEWRVNLTLGGMMSRTDSIGEAERTSSFDATADIFDLCAGVTS